MKKKKWIKDRIVGVALLLVSAALLIAGVIVSLHVQMPRLFWAFSTPAAILIVLGGVKVLEAAWFFRRTPAKVEAEVIGVTRNIRNAGDKMAYYVLCKWTDPKTGKEFTYTSRPLQEYPGKEVIGKTVTVHLDWKDPGNYTVDLEPILPDGRK